MGVAMCFYPQDPVAVVNNLFVAFAKSFAAYYPDIETASLYRMGQILAQILC